MRITFNTSTTETVEYLRVVNTILRNNQATSDTVEAYNALKALVESYGKRLERLEASERRNRVCR